MLAISWGIIPPAIVGHDGKKARTVAGRARHMVAVDALASITGAKAMRLSRLAPHAPPGYPDFRWCPRSSANALMGPRYFSKGSSSTPGTSLLFCSSRRFHRHAPAGPRCTHRNRGLRHPASVRSPAAPPWREEVRRGHTAHQGRPVWPERELADAPNAFECPRSFSKGHGGRGCHAHRSAVAALCNDVSGITTSTVESETTRHLLQHHIKLDQRIIRELLVIRIPYQVAPPPLPQALLLRECRVAEF